MNKPDMICGVHRTSVQGTSRKDYISSLVGNSLVSLELFLVADWTSNQGVVISQRHQYSPVIEDILILE